MTDATEAAASLREAVLRLKYDGSKQPANDTLRNSWPGFGRSWVAEWAAKLGRDAAIIALDLEAARGAATDGDAETLLENAAWRLGAAREKLHAVIALSYGRQALRIGEGKKQRLSFEPDTDDTREKLRGLRAASPAADAVIQADGQLKAILLLRHQATHSLAPLTTAPSLLLFEEALLENGRVLAYFPFHLPPKGLEKMKDIGAASLRERATKLLERGLVALADATRHLATLLDETAELEPPPIIWRAKETNRRYYTRDEAAAASRAAAQADD
jgi:hypothetical protein